MDAEFHRRWHENLSPFDGVTVTLSGLVPLPLLRNALAVIVEHLYERDFVARLFRLLDWQEHDGYVSESHASSWDELRASIASPEALRLRFLNGDSYVREAFFPTDRSYYLRFYVADRDDNGRLPDGSPDLADYGTFDLTCAEPLAVPIADAVAATGLSSIEIVDAKTFFGAKQ